MVSTNLREYIQLALEETGWQEYFDMFLGIEDVERTKPDPEVYRKALQQFGLDPEEAVIVEDSRVGLDSALATGCKVICRRESRYQVNQDGADYYVDALTEIPELLKTMN